MANIVLTGFMGTGKSSVGRGLAKELKLKFLDTDALIEEEAGIPIKEIFAGPGEPHFRGLERDLILRLTGGELGSGLVVSTGGGVVVDSGSRAALRGWAVVICLTASVEEIVGRIGSSLTRPLTAAGDKVAKVTRLREERLAAYKDCDLMIDTTGESVEGVVMRIKAFMKERAVADHQG
jgi:shikimate kinase